MRVTIRFSFQTPHSGPPLFFNLIVNVLMFCQKILKTNYEISNKDRDEIISVLMVSPSLKMSRGVIPKKI